MQLLTVMFRTIFFYFFITLAYRLMGKREVGQLGIVDLIVSILIAELVAISIENHNDSIFLTIIPISILVVMEIFLAYITMKSSALRTILDGKPSLIISHGILNYKEMIKQRYSLEDLLLAMRQKEIKSIEDIEYAFLEPNGKLSVFKYNFFKIKSDYPAPLIMDGKINIKSLKQIKKSETWLRYELGRKKLELNEIFYAFYRKNQLYIIKKGNSH